MIAREPRLVTGSSATPSPYGVSWPSSGNGKRGGGNWWGLAFLVPPRCYCGREMEQVTSIGAEPEHGR